MATLELHIVLRGKAHYLKMMEHYIREYTVKMGEIVNAEFEIAGGLIEKDEAHGEENSEGVPNGK